MSNKQRAVFDAQLMIGGTVTIPAKIRRELGLRFWDNLRVTIVKEQKVGVQSGH
jgi:bifunctional DNA-binding transcriptional regulator/antitoxin component of YhaV-PrlF toxin-antitoxin module